MAFYTGSASSFSDLRAALFSACVDEGWTVADADTLTKGAAVVRATISVSNTSATGPGIVLQGATGLSGGALVNPSTNTPRFGRPHQTINPETWPMTYYIHIFSDPDEVFMVANFNVDSYWWLAFGVSDTPGLPGSGLWLSAISRGGRGSTAFAGGISLGSSFGGSNGNDNHSSGGIFCQTAQGVTANPNNDTIQSGLDGTLWAGNPSSPNAATISSFNGWLAASTLIGRLPSAWNAEAILIPIQGYVWRASNKCSLVVDVNNARYTRVDNYTPGQIITLGSDQWRIYPFYKKNTTARDAGNGVDHTGTFGWAIRYDGP